MRGCALGALLKELNDSEWVDASPASGQFITFRFHYNPLKVYSGLVAHLGEHPPCKRKVAGSIPVWSTIDSKVTKIQSKNLWPGQER